MTEENESNLIEIQDEDGNIIKCEVFDIVEFEGKTYALVYPLDQVDSEEPEGIILEYFEEGDEGFFQSVDDEDEFNRVCEFFESIDYDDEDEDE